MLVETSVKAVLMTEEEREREDDELLEDIMLKGYSLRKVCRAKAKDPKSRFSSWSRYD